LAFAIDDSRWVVQHRLRGSAGPLHAMGRRLHSTAAPAFEEGRHLPRAAVSVPEQSRRQRAVVRALAPCPA